jgi:hypothetical protein
MENYNSAFWHSVCAEVMEQKMSKVKIKWREKKKILFQFWTTIKI